MLDIAISIRTDSFGCDIIETNHGNEFMAPDWPHDCEFQIVAYHPLDKTCRVVSANALADDIGKALLALRASAGFKGDQQEWYRRLADYSSGTPSMTEPE